MKSMGTLAMRYLWYQKKRTALTILGIIISVSMFTSIATLMLSFRDAELKRVKEVKGVHHASLFSHKKQYENIALNPHIDKVAYSYFVGRGYVYDYPIHLYSYKGDYLYLKNLSFSKGREPQKTNEIVLSTKVARKLELSVGDTLLMSVDGIYNYRNDDGSWMNENHYLGEKEFKISGLIESDNHHQTAYVSHDYVERNQGNVLFTVKDGLAVRDVVEDIAPNNGMINYNNTLLILQGRVQSDYYKGLFISVAAIVMLLVLVVCGATVAVTYNSFNISVLERIRQFGIISSVGATPKQLRRIVLVEAGVQALIAIPLGLIFGVVAMHIVFYLLSISAYTSFTGVSLSYSIKMLLICAAIGCFSVFLSALTPVILAGKKRSLEAIFYRPKVSPIFRKRKGFIIKRFFSAEKTLAYKNLQRNKKRTVLTALSLGVSVILLIVFSVFSYYSYDVKNTRNMYDNDFEITRTYGDPYPEETLNQIEQLEGIKTVQAHRNHSVFAVVEPDKVKNESKSYSCLADGGSNVISGKISGYSESQLNAAKDHLLKGEVNKKQMMNENGVLLVQSINNRQSNTRLIDYEVGDQIKIFLDKAEAELHIQNPEDYDCEEFITLTVKGILEKDLFNLNNEGIHLIALDDYYKTNLKEGYDKFYVNAVDDLDTDTHMQLVEQLEDISRKSKGGRFTDYFYNVRRDKQIFTESSVFAYGFIALIGFLGALNIINTVNANLLTRTKEFAMLMSVGIGPKSLARMVRWEAIMSGLIGVIYGCIIGNLLGYLLYLLMNDVTEIAWKFPWAANITVIIATIMVSLLASRATVQQVKKMNIIETLREE
ncbi:FtsX-like permease family protein [Proteinivorax tanatarense]|uniref:FtsX-like permease family protein n=1 Tax=Proteinivorax tanatarense TaxID=1260629 RepID=A0AAU7VKL8_9FIRM